VSSLIDKIVTEKLGIPAIDKVIIKGIWDSTILQNEGQDKGEPS
jgi:hypothetical protein